MRFVLKPHGPVVFILDTGAQVNVMAPENAHLLVRRGPPPPNLALFGAGDAQLRVREVGMMAVVSAAAIGLPGQISMTVQMTNAQCGYWIGVVSVCTASALQLPSRGRGRLGHVIPRLRRRDSRLDRGSHRRACGHRGRVAGTRLF